MRIGHASISENKNNGRDGRAQAGDQTNKEVCIRSFYVKPWKYLLRCKDHDKALIMADACESICNNSNVGYDQSQRLTLHNELSRIGFDYRKLTTPCECDCSSFMTVCAECAGIMIPYSGGNAPVTANMVKLFEKTGMFEVITNDINDEYNLKRGDILVGPPNTHTVMVLDDGVPLHLKKRRTLKIGMSGTDVRYMQNILLKLNYDLGKWGADGEFGNKTSEAVKKFQGEHGLVVDGIVGIKTWTMLEKYD
jgi:hypothetical protein